MELMNQRYVRWWDPSPYSNNTCIVGLKLNSNRKIAVLETERRETSLLGFGADIIGLELSCQNSLLVLLEKELVLITFTHGFPALKYTFREELQESKIFRTCFLRSGRLLLKSKCGLFLSAMQGAQIHGKLINISDTVILKNLRLEDCTKTSVNWFCTSEYFEEILWVFGRRCLLWTTIEIGTKRVVIERMVSEGDNICMCGFLRNDYFVFSTTESGKHLLKVFQVSRHKEKGVGLKEKASYEMKRPIVTLVKVDEKLVVFQNSEGQISINTIKHLLSRSPEVGFSY